MAAASVILGLSMLTVSHLKAERLWLGWLPYFRIGLLGLGVGGAVAMNWALVRRSTVGMAQKCAATLALLVSPALMAGIWSLVFFIW